MGLKREVHAGAQSSLELEVYFNLYFLVYMWSSTFLVCFSAICISSSDTAINVIFNILFY